MKTVAFIPVRGGSKSIPGKNIKPLGGRPLLHWTLEAACQAQRIDEVVVSSDSEEILACARAFAHPKVVAVLRPSEFATDTASTESAMLDYAENNQFDRMVLVQATSPLTTSGDLDGAIAHMEELGADSLLSGTHEFRFRWGRDQAGTVVAENYQPVTRPRRQDWAGEFMENGAFYVTSHTLLLESRCRISGKIAFWVMPGHTAVEIDTPDDWEILEALVAKAAKKSQPTAASSNQAPRDIRLLITDVDGVLTDGGMYYGPEGEAFKKFNTRDGMASALWRKAGLHLAIVTGEDSPSVKQRAKKLKITELHNGVSDKLPVVRALAEKYNLSLQQIAYIGDEINDLEAMGAVGFVGCPADAHASVRAAAHFICNTKGGDGCLREFVDHILSGV
jgi:YrbI family 3-deoxy-D-manno-octulosonate 8-phosphate phosphatase